MNHKSHADVDRRLAKISGHVEGIRRMIAQDKGCVEILQQMKAVMSALDSTRKILLKDHVQHCLAEALEQKTPSSAVEEIEAILSQIL
ncbi:MAG: metal-sensitive transcriptional regulator [Candidatus Riflebacteria bacterium]|nr:metal-sensitive transcriptional regulator [Candidatus Riflebacteria bacterium]